jgi:hypothetical protein
LAVTLQVMGELGWPVAVGMLAHAVRWVAITGINSATRARMARKTFRSQSRNGHPSVAFLDGMIKMVAGPCRGRASDRHRMLAGFI